MAAGGRCAKAPGPPRRTGVAAAPTGSAGRPAGGCAEGHTPAEWLRLLGTQSAAWQPRGGLAAGGGKQQTSAQKRKKKKVAGERSARMHAAAPAGWWRGPAARRRGCGCGGRSKKQNGAPPPPRSRACAAVALAWGAAGWGGAAAAAAGDGRRQLGLGCCLLVAGACTTAGPLPVCPLSGGYAAEVVAGGGGSARLFSRWLRGGRGARGWRGRRCIIVGSFVRSGVVEPRQHGRSDAIVPCSSREDNYDSPAARRGSLHLGAKRDSIHICCRAACGSAVAPATAGWGTCLAASLQTAGPLQRPSRPADGAGRARWRSRPPRRLLATQAGWGQGGETSCGAGPMAVCRGRGAAPWRRARRRSAPSVTADALTVTTADGAGVGLLERPPSDASPSLTLCPPLSAAAPPQSRLVSPTAACHPATRGRLCTVWRPRRQSGGSRGGRGDQRLVTRLAVDESLHAAAAVNQHPPIHPRP